MLNVFISLFQVLFLYYIVHVHDRVMFYFTYFNLLYSTFPLANCLFLSFVIIHIPIISLLFRLYCLKLFTFFPCERNTLSHLIDFGTYACLALVRRLLRSLNHCFN